VWLRIRPMSVLQTLSKCAANESRAALRGLPLPTRKLCLLQRGVAALFDGGIWLEDAQQQWKALRVVLPTRQCMAWCAMSRSILRAALWCRSNVPSATHAFREESMTLMCRNTAKKLLSNARLAVRYQYVQSIARAIHSACD
jgi:hypothetical protein